MNCYVHPDISAVGTCSACGKGVCAECATMVGGKLYCKDCLTADGLPRSGETNKLALASMILGIVSLPLDFCFYAGIPVGIAAVVVGAIGLKRIKESAGTQGGKGMAIAGIVTGAVASAVMLIAVVVIAVLSLLGPSVGNVFSQINSSMGH
jgi:Flp pilus assembly pilin Flp